MKYFCLVFIFVMSFQGNAAEDFSIIVNIENSYDEFDAPDFFLLKRSNTQWPDGFEVLPVIVKSENSRVAKSREVFLDQILGFQSEASYSKYWIRQKSKGQTRRPKEFSDFRKVLKYVEREEGAIGYIPKLMLGTSKKVKEIDRFKVK